MEEQYNKTYIRELAHKWRAGSLTTKERQHLESWDKGHFDDILSLEENSNPNEILGRLLTRINSEIARETVPIRKISLWPRIAVAAAMATIVFGAGLFYYNLNINKQQSGQVALKNDVAPGNVGATLTLANGKKIKLSDAANGEIAKEAGISVTKTVDGQLIYKIEESAGEKGKINTLSTARGETYILTLSDKTQVWLNAASSLTYSAALNEHGQRRVKLSGEAYFQVAKDKLHPFIVETDDQEVEVLGTHFNVMAYADEPIIATTLLEGSVKLISSGKVRILKPNEQALNNGESIKVIEANLENITDWKDGDFYFERVDFRSVMRKIARWYDVDVIYDSSVPDNIKSGGWMSRNNKLSAVLQSIEKSGQVHFKIDGKKVYVKK